MDDKVLRLMKEKGYPIPEGESLEEHAGRIKEYFWANMMFLIKNGLIDWKLPEDYIKWLQSND